MSLQCSYYLFVKVIKKLIRNILGVVDPNGDFIFMISRMAGRIKIPNNSMTGDVLTVFLKEMSLGKQILEFGSGGSTLVFAQSASKTVSVESDRCFSQNINKILRTYQLTNKTNIFWVNIGPTKSFGQPWKTLKHLKQYRYQKYSSQVFNAFPEVNLSDLVFIDGRFRVACAMKSILNIKKDFTLVIDDYLDRPEYSVIARVLGAPNDSIMNTAIFYVQTKNVSQNLAEYVYAAYKNDYR